MSPGAGDTRHTSNARRRLPPERLAPLLQAHQDASLTHPEEQETHEAILSLLQGVAAGEITVARLAYAGSRMQALRFADVPGPARLYRQAATDLEHLEREVHQARP